MEENKDNVEEVLEETEGVFEAIVSHTNGTAIVSMTSALSDELLAKVITDNGYKVIDISDK